MRALVFAAVAALVATTPIAATTYSFHLVGNDEFSWSLPSSPTPNCSTQNADVISGFCDLSGRKADLLFLVGSAGGGVLVFGGADDNFNIARTSGPQLFEGTTSAPTFLLGTFDLYSSSGPYTLTVAEVATVAEPATWATLITGFAFSGVAKRRARRSTLGVAGRSADRHW